MKPFKARGGRKPETKRQKEWIRFLTARGWVVKETHGSAYSSGWPDLFIFRRIGKAKTWRPGDHKWIDIKIVRSGKIHLTEAQHKFWPIMLNNGQGVWILTEVSDREYKKLFGPPNLVDYMLQGLIT
jgi:hypothetical protein